MEIAAGKFKAQCLELMDLVAQTDVEITITKRGKPVARLVPTLPEKHEPIFGSMKGMCKIHGDIVDPIEPSPWNALIE